LFINPHSLILKLILFFVLLLVALNIILFQHLEYQKNYQIEVLLDHFHYDRRGGKPKRHHPAHRPPKSGIPHKHHKTWQTLKYATFRSIDEQAYTKAHKQGSLIATIRDFTFVYHDNAVYYEHYKHRDDTWEYFILTPYTEQTRQLKAIIIIVNLLLLLFLAYLIKRLLPLHTLQQAIFDFAHGKPITLHTEGKDEIASVSKAFKAVANKAKDLQEGRTLFLRNIIHELKTPLAEGQLIAELMSDKKNTKRLQKVLIRLNRLINEFSKLESVTSHAMQFNMHHYQLNNILEHALELLLIQPNSIEVHKTHTIEVYGDFEYLAIVLKNLIANGLKHGEDKPTILCKESHIEVHSKGKALKNTDFTKPFNRTHEGSGNGLGLGLYICHSILQKHGYRMSYTHENGVNIFRVHF
jgi:signal transduction histidine kinase